MEQRNLATVPICGFLGEVHRHSIAVFVRICEISSADRNNCGRRHGMSTVDDRTGVVSAKSDPNRIF